MTSDIESFKFKLGKRIKELRESKGLTQPELGALIDKDYQAVGRIEAGRINPSAFIVYQIAKALKVSANDIFNF